MGRTTSAALALARSWTVAADDERGCRDPNRKRRPKDVGGALLACRDAGLPHVSTVRRAFKGQDGSPTRPRKKSRKSAEEGPVPLSESTNGPERTSSGSSSSEPAATSSNVPPHLGSGFTRRERTSTPFPRGLWARRATSLSVYRAVSERRPEKGVSRTLSWPLAGWSTDCSRLGIWTRFQCRPASRDAGHGRLVLEKRLVPRSASVAAFRGQRQAQGLGEVQSVGSQFLARAFRSPFARSGLTVAPFLKARSGSAMPPPAATGMFQSCVIRDPHHPAASCSSSKPTDLIGQHPAGTPRSPRRHPPGSTWPRMRSWCVR